MKGSRQWISQGLSRIMPYKRYAQLRKYMRFGPPKKERDPDDPISKIRELINMLNVKFQHYYYPGEWLCLDEGMIPFNGRLSFKIYNPDKPTKWGIKEYVLSDASVQYTLLIKLHDGVDDNDDEW